MLGVAIPFIPRTRSSVLTQFCAAAGREVLGDFTPKNRNPLGDGEGKYSYDGGPFDTLAENQVVKVLVPGFLQSPIPSETRVLFPLRRPGDVSASQARHEIWPATDFARRMNYWRWAGQFFEWMVHAPNPVLVVDMDALIQDPRQALDRVAAFIGVGSGGAWDSLVFSQMTETGEEERQDSALGIYQAFRDWAAGRRDFAVPAAAPASTRLYRLPMRFNEAKGQIEPMYLGQFIGARYAVTEEEGETAIVRARLSAFDHRFLSTLPEARDLGEAE